jgi:large subunit ribosomal protein L21
MSEYAIISVGGKQYVVREGERLLVDRLATAEGKTFQPSVLFVGGDGKATLSPRTAVTAKVVGHVRGEKIRIGKYKPKTGYRRHTGFRAALSQIEIQSIGAKSSSTKTATEEKPKAAASPSAAKPKTTATKKPAARKPAAKKTTENK